MPTKPALQPEPWATAGNYPASVFPAKYPWGEDHPQAGLPTPWSNQPRTVAAGLAAFAADGTVPLQADKGELWNEEYQRVVELTRWVFLGTTAPDEDAHIVETDTAGLASLHSLSVGVPDPLGTAIPFTALFQGSGPNSDAIVAIGTGTGRAAGMFGAGGDTVLDVLATGGNTIGIRCEGAGTANTLEATTDGAGAGVYAAATSTGDAIVGLGSATSSAIVGQSDPSGTAAAIVGTGSTGAATSDGVQGFAANAGAKGVLGQSSASPTEFSGAGVRGQGLAQGIGVWASSADSYALYVVGDLTSPRRAAARLVPQDADPTVPLPGDILWQSGRGPTGKLRLGNGASVYESAHSSPKGRVFGIGPTAAGGPTGGGSGDISSFQIQPEETGDILLVLTTGLDFSVTNGTCTLLIRDVTNAATIATTVIPAPDRDGTAPERANPVFRVRYTLPDTALRTFAAQVQAGTGSISWDNLILTGEGVF